MRRVNIKELLSLHETKFLSFYKIKYENKIGEEKTWYSSSRRGLNDLKRFMEDVSAIEADAVVMIPYDEEKKCLVLLEEDRIPIGHSIYSFPAGLVEKGEDVFDSARRELKEETGLELKEIMDFGAKNPTFMTPGMSEECASIYYCSVSGGLSRDFLEADENIRPFYCDKDLAREILDGDYLLDTKVMLVLQMFVYSNIFEEAIFKRV